MPVPNVFIGCSSEALDRAEEISSALKERLKDRAKIITWNEPAAFSVGDVLIKRLVEITKTIDFAILLLSPTKPTGEIAPNVMFELGLFLGELEPYRAIFVKDGVELPSDLDGVIYLDMADGIDFISDNIADRIFQFGNRIARAVELGSLERMLNVCTPGYDDHETPNLSEIKPNPQEMFARADDFRELCQCLLNRYVIASMGPEDTKVLRAYFAIYIGDGIDILSNGKPVTIRRCKVPASTQERADATFLIAISNPRQYAPDKEFSGQLLANDWNIGLPISGYRDNDPTKPRSTCASVFADRADRHANANDGINLDEDSEQEVFAVPVLWKERRHTASIGVLGLSSSDTQLRSAHKPIVSRLQLVANVLGVAANRLCVELSPAIDTGIGIAVDDVSERRSFARRAVALRRAIGVSVIDDLLEKGKMTVSYDNEEPVLQRQV